MHIFKQALFIERHELWSNNCGYKVIAIILCFLHELKNMLPVL